MVLDDLWQRGLARCVSDPQFYAGDLSREFPDRSFSAVAA